MHQLQPQPEVTTSLQFNTRLTSENTLEVTDVQRSQWENLQTEAQQVDWLILHFNRWFSHLNVILVRGDFEPEYFPATKDQPARIQFAHGFFNIALH